MSFKIFLKKFDKKFKELEKHLKKLNYVPLKIRSPKIRYPEILRLYDTDTYWTIDIREWKMIRNEKHSYKDVENYIDKKLSYKRGNEILLIHDHEETHQYFKFFIDKFISKGYSFLDIPK